MAYRTSREPTKVTKARIKAASHRLLAAKEKYDMAEENLERLLKASYRSGTTQVRLSEIADGTTRGTVARLVNR